MALRPIAASLALVATVAVVMPATGEAKATDSGRHKVTTTKLNVYEQPTKSYIGVLSKGETFDVKKLSASGKYAYGTAYGHVDKKGWVDASALQHK